MGWKKKIVIYSSFFLWLVMVFMTTGCEEVNKSPLSSMEGKEARNVLGGKLAVCCTDPMTGFYRDGSCHTGPDDYGTHVVCAQMTQDFLDYTVAQGNDLCTARPDLNFPGLKKGDQWCLCAVRWLEAYHAGVAPPVFLEATHEKALQIIDLARLSEYAVQSN